MSEKKPHRTFTYETLTEDTPDALAVGGFDDEQVDEQRAPAVAEDVGFGRAVRLFYRHYWNDRGTASASEFRYAMLYLVVGTVLYFGVTLLLNYLIIPADASSLVRTLFMLFVITNPLWIAMNIAPTVSLVKRRKAAKKRV
ncbi:MAG: hypothetical protein Q3965_05735 [Rothia sp. (in: high G+C Gram-positive bacteria)]|nr:hypothetical protein [Rothia sp. (in: high G+C Gram-positive bacteria)]